jgi:hypothetical protein
MDPNAQVTTVRWNSIPADPLPRAGEFEPLLFPKRPGLIGIPRMRAMLEAFVNCLPGEERPVASIADVHGNVEGLRRELNLCRARGIRGLVATGDLVDRDPHSVQVVQEVDAAAEHFEFVEKTVGNHDLFFLRAMGGSRRDLGSWLGNGGLSVLAEEEVGLGHWISYIAHEAELSATAPIRWVRNVLYQKPDVLDRIMRDIQGNDCLNWVAGWMRKNMHLSYLSESGILYIHAGIDSDRKGNPKLEYRSGGQKYEGLWALAKVEEELFSALEQGLTAHPAYQFLENPHSPVWIRDWEAGAELDMERCERLLDGLGVTGIVVGHTVQSRTKGVQDGRLILADRGLAKAYQDQPGIVLVEPGHGVRCITSAFRELSPSDRFAQRVERSRFQSRQTLARAPDGYDDTPTIMRD